jgi:hypothetical protein
MNNSNLDKQYVVIIIIGIFAIGISMAEGYFVPKSSLEMYVENDLIIMGEIISLNEVVDDVGHVPKTQYEVLVLQNIKGTTETDKILATGLGAINATRHVENETILSEEQKVLLFLNKEKSDEWIISPHSIPSDEDYPDSGFILPPLKLYNAGIPIEDIHCKSSFILAIKSANYMPVCLTPSSFDRLSDREWIR